jgi:glucosyl-3-phosphoglycerate synthase
MRPEVLGWFNRRTYRSAEVPDAATLLTRKNGQTVSVALPARDEAETVGAVVEAVLPLVDIGLVDELIVLDDSSRDDTARVAAAAGAQVVSLADVLPAYGTRTGKGNALWKGLAATDGDLIVFLDADLLGVTPSWVTGLLWPLLAEPEVAYVKASYARPLALPDSPVQSGGGRVTELTARPLIDLLWPELAGIAQPLGGEYAGRRSLLERLKFDAGYAVELGLLVDILAEVGLDGLAQVDLGVRRHRHQSTEALGRMAAAITAAALQRVGVELAGEELVQFASGPDGPQPVTWPVVEEARPPMITVPEYAARRARAS